jgi:hypothetical protein
LTETRIAIIGDYGYGSPEVIRSFVSKISLESTLVFTSVRGVCRIAKQAADERGLKHETFEWECKAHLVIPKAEKIVLFSSGTKEYYFKEVIHQALEAHRTLTLIDSTGKTLDLPSNGHVKVPTKEKPQMPIIDALTGSKVKRMITLPENIDDRILELAAAEKVSPEQFIVEKIRRHLEHNGTRGLWFNDAQRSELERMTGGHLINSSEDALAKVRTTCMVIVDDVAVVIPTNMKQRIASRAKACRKNVADWITKEVYEGLERACGLRP